MSIRNLAAYALSAYLSLIPAASLSSPRHHPSQNRVYHEFSPKKTELAAIVSPGTDYASSLIKTARKKYGDRLEFAVNGPYFDPRHGKSCGRIISGGVLITEGVSDAGVALIYDESFGGMLDIRDSEKIQYTPEFMMDSLVSIFPEYAVRGRDIGSNRTYRMFIGIKECGNGVIIYDRSRPREARGLREKYHFVKSAIGDGGSSAMFYEHGNFLIKPSRKLKSIVVGIKKPDKPIEPKQPFGKMLAKK